MDPGGGSGLAQIKLGAMSGETERDTKAWPPSNVDYKKDLGEEATTALEKAVGTVEIATTRFGNQ